MLLLDVIVDGQLLSCCSSSTSITRPVACSFLFSSASWLFVETYSTWICLYATEQLRSSGQCKVLTPRITTSRLYKNLIIIITLLNDYYYTCQQITVRSNIFCIVATICTVCKALSSGPAPKSRRNWGEASRHATGTNCKCL